MNSSNNDENISTTTSISSSIIEGAYLEATEDQQLLLAIFPRIMSGLSLLAAISICFTVFGPFQVTNFIPNSHTYTSSICRTVFEVAHLFPNSNTYCNV